MISRNKGLGCRLGMFGLLVRRGAFDPPPDQAEGLQSYSVATNLTRIYAT